MTMRAGGIGVHRFVDGGQHLKRNGRAMTQPASPPHTQTSLRALMTRARWMEIVRILLVGVITVLYWQHLLPLGVLLAAVVVGLYPLVKTGLLDLRHEHKIGTEIFVTVATSIAVIGGEYVAAAVLMDIIRASV